MIQIMITTSLLPVKPLRNQLDFGFFQPVDQLNYVNEVETRIKWRSFFFFFLNSIALQHNQCTLKSIRFREMRTLCQGKIEKQQKKTELIFKTIRNDDVYKQKNRLCLVFYLLCARWLDIPIDILSNLALSRVLISLATKLN